MYAALAGNLLVALTKAAAAVWTGSSAMRSEAIHSFVDCGNELLLLYGMRRALRRADPEHPLGYGRELYFWSFIVAVLVFALGAGLSTYQGVARLRAPEPIEDPLVSYVVLGLAFLFEGASWLVSLRQFRRAKGALGFLAAARTSKDPPSFIVFFEDTAALLGLALAALGTWLATSHGAPRFDGLASIAIGLVLAATAMLLARESKSLLIGEPAAPRLRDSIARIAGANPSFARVNGVLTAQLAPDQIMAALSIEFADDVPAARMEECVIEVESQMRTAHPEIVTIFIKPQTRGTYREVLRRRYGTA